MPAFGCRSYADPTGAESAGHTAATGFFSPAATRTVRGFVAIRYFGVILNVGIFRAFTHVTTTVADCACAVLFRKRNVHPPPPTVGYDLSATTPKTGAVTPPLVGA